MALVIDAQDLHKRYPGCPPVLRGASLRVESGEMAAIMGPSGCGKSTMLHLLGLLHTPDAGALRMLDADVLRFDREQAALFRRRNLGFVMQSSNLFDFSTVYENVEFPLIYDQAPFEERRERILRALELVHLSARVHYRSNQLSGGEQQRVAIARAMVNNPRILFADEPTGALDARTSRSIMTSFRALAHNGGVSMVVVTHDPTVAEYCDSIYTLDDGRLICRRKEAIPPPEGGALPFGMPDVSAPVRLMNAVCVAGRIPMPNDVAMRQLVLRLYDDGVVSKVYSAYAHQNKDMNAAMHIELPAPVKHVGLWRAPLAILACLRHVRHSPLLWKLWRALPVNRRRRGTHALRRLWHFLCGPLMARWCVEDGAEMLHALRAGGPATAAWVANALTGVPFSFAVRTVDLLVPDPALPVKANAAAFICCDTEATLAAVRAICPGLPQDRCVLLRDGLTFPESDVMASLEELGLTDGAAARGRSGIFLLAVGTLTARKGFDDLLRACALLLKAGVAFRCRIVGDGPMKWRLRWLARRLGLAGQVEFCGQAPHERIRHMMVEASIFVAPGVAGAGGQDGLPTALIEAMQYALPVIVSDLAGQVEAVRHGASGLVVPQRSPQAIADAVLRLGTDPAQARNMGLEARRWALENLDPERCGAELAQRLLASRGISRKALDEAAQSE
ncbi:MAG: ATP-binding cassette domain-containing protein [Deltaproteobacteria bacterium]|jgi:ABC-type lipoprotein export system ATPase subunit/glycosyltransferase involved in cell wall biosynthesis|nr:ATP-binding cassette domain-containing protein [Deltaproteobacteria bacterium]